MNNNIESINSYASTSGNLFLHYKDGQLSYISPHEKIEWDGLKHHIEFYEEDLNKQKFKLVE